MPGFGAPDEGSRVVTPRTVRGGRTPVSSIRLTMAWPRACPAAVCRWIVNSLRDTRQRASPVALRRPGGRRTARSSCAGNPPLKPVELIAQLQDTELEASDFLNGPTLEYLPGIVLLGRQLLHLSHVIEELEHQVMCSGIDLLGVVGHEFKHGAEGIVEASTESNPGLIRTNGRRCAGPTDLVPACLLSCVVRSAVTSCFLALKQMVGVNRDCPRSP